MISNGLQSCTKARFRQLPAHIVPDHRAQTPAPSRVTSLRQTPAFRVESGHILGQCRNFLIIEQDGSTYAPTARWARRARARRVKDRGPG